MPWTADTPVASVSLTFNPVLRTLSGGELLSDEDPAQYLHLPWNDMTAEFTGDQATLDTLRANYALHGQSFRDRDGNIVAGTVEGARSYTTLAALPGVAGEDWGNPFVLATGMSMTGVSSYGDRYHTLRRWTKSATRPSAPTADWWDPDSGVVPLTNWFSRATASGVLGDAPLWIAEDAVSIAGDGTRSYQGWTITQEFGVESSEDRSTWVTPPNEDHRYFAFLTPDGHRRIIDQNPVDLGWVELYQGTPYKGAASATVADFGGTINLDLYRRLRFRWQAFGAWDSGSQENQGGECICEVVRPTAGGWESSTFQNDDDTSGTAGWWFDDSAGAAVIFHEPGSREHIHLLDSITRSGTLNGSGLPAQRISGKMKFIGSDSNHDNLVQSARFYDFVSGSDYERFNLIIEGATY